MSKKSKYTEREMVFLSLILQLVDDCNPNLEFISPKVRVYIDDMDDKLREVYEKDDEEYMNLKYYINILLEEDRKGLH